ncbi:MAG: lipopolysaccharide biosynthesis protein [Actinobacteria bacterium]|nr:lipopolysaccharide biosynthesis protein [Actinomycetota bacterium]
MTRASTSRVSVASGLSGITTRGVGAVLQLGITVLIGRSLGASAVAIYIGISVWFRIAEVLLGLGVGPQLLRDASRLPQGNSALGLFHSGERAVRYMLAGSALVGLVGAAVAVVLGRSDAAAVILIAGVGGTAAARLKLLADVLKARRWSRAGLAFEFSVAPLVTMILVALLVFAGGEATIVAWVVSYGIGVVVSMVGASLVLRTTQRTLVPVEVEPYSGRSAESRRFMSSALVGFGLWSMPVLVVPLLVSGADAGRFSLSFRLLSVADLILVGLAAVFAPVFSAAWADNRMTDLRRQFRNSRLLSVATFFPFVLGVVVFGRFVLGIFGEEFVSAYPILLIASVGHVVNALTGLVSELLLMTRAEDKELRIGLVAMGFMVIALVPATELFGVAGAAAVYSTSIVIKNGLSYFAVRTRLQVVATQSFVSSVGGAAVSGPAM